MTQELALAIRRQGVDFRILHIQEKLRWPFTMMGRYRVHKVTHAPETDPDWVLRCPVTALPGALAISLRARMWRAKAWKMVREAWGDFTPDLVHGRMFMPSAIIAEEFSDRWNVPLVVCTHGADTRSFINRALERKDILRLCGRANAVVCVSNTIRQLLLGHGAAGENIHVIDNGMDQSKIFNGENSIRRRYEGKTIVLGVGNLKNIKGFDYLIEAMASLQREYPDLVCLIVGDGNEYPHLQAMIDRHNLSGVVELVGGKPAAEVMEYMDACDIFCLPSWSEGFGIVYLEALAQGKPIIAVQGQGITDIVTAHRVGLLVKPRSVDAVVDAIVQLVRDPKLRREMGLRGSELVRGNFSWDASAHNYIAIYKKLLEGIAPA